MPAYIRTSDHLTIVFDDGASATVYESGSNFSDVVNALALNDYARARYLALPTERLKAQINAATRGNELVTVEHGIVKYDGRTMNNSLTQRMLTMLAEGFDITPLKLFLINLQQNPSFRAVNELYGFLEKGNLPITEDGYFLAYKKVDQNYKDCHTHTIDNRVGQVVEMRRNEVDEDSRNECSNGLHFCSREYLSNFTGAHTMIVKVNPADVVAIPADYNSSKGRTCRYEVIAELGVDGKYVDSSGNLEGAYRDTGTQQPASGALTNLADDWLSEDEEDEDWLDDEDDFDDLDDDDDVETASLEDRVAEGQEENEIDPTQSGFAGIPGDSDPVVVPRAVALEIAASLDDDVDDDEFSYIEATNVETDAVSIFDDIHEGSERTGANISSIRKVLNGTRKTAGGYTWQRVFE